MATKNIPMPSGNVEWTQIPKDGDVIDGGNHWQYDGKTVFWSGEVAAKAQAFLRTATVLTKRRAKRVRSQSKAGA